jgi:hypothetical protein
MVRELLNHWDPVGVADEVDDEYECMEPTLGAMVHEGASAAEFKAYLWRELRDHFGLQPELLSVDGAAFRLEALGSQRATSSG